MSPVIKLEELLTSAMPHSSCFCSDSLAVDQYFSVLSQYTPLVFHLSLDTEPISGMLDYRSTPDLASLAYSNCTDFNPLEKE